MWQVSCVQVDSMLQLNLKSVVALIQNVMWMFKIADIISD